jgi:hypothetical protein
MPESPKKEKKTCSYEFEDYKCDQPLYDKTHCIFHSEDWVGKENTFMERFWQEYDSQKKKGKFIFTGFVFPPEADLQGADLKKADLREANLLGADLQGARLHGARLQKAYLRGADLQRAILHGADLRGANLRGSSFEKARVYEVKYDRSTKFRGIDVTQARGSPSFVRFAQDQDFLEEFKSSWKRIPLYVLWLTLADCGRSMFRWMFLSSLLAFLFAYKYILAYGDNPKSFIFATHPESIITFFYYSVVTFTTLGFGDVVPATESLKIWVMVEVIVGYVMLGGLISIFANKLARRS